MAIKFKNNAVGALDSGITDSATTLDLGLNEGDLFPAVADPHYFYATLTDASGNIEIIKVTARSAASDTFTTIVRAQEGTAARAWLAGDKCELRLTAAVIEALTDYNHTHANQAQLDLVTDGDHDVRTDNPHSVTKTQVSLGNVPNLDTTSAVTNDHTHANKAQLDLVTDGDHDVRTDNPHSVNEGDILPSMSGNSGKFLTNNGSASSWSGLTIPSQQILALIDVFSTEYWTDYEYQFDFRVYIPSSAVTLTMSMMAYSLGGRINSMKFMVNGSSSSVATANEASYTAKSCSLDVSSLNGWYTCTVYMKSSQVGYTVFMKNNAFAISD